VPGNFDKALETMRELENLRTTSPNLTLYVNSVITRENKGELIPLGRYFNENHDLDGHYFQIIRGDPKDRTLQSVRAEELKEIYKEAVPLNFRYISKTMRLKGRLNGLRKAFWKAGYAFTYDTQLKNYSRGAKWKMPCTAGQTSIVIDWNGDVRVCELRKPIGNLRKYGMDFQKFWYSTERRTEIRRIGLDQCFCTHICFMYDSMRHSKRVMLWELPKLAIKLATQRLLRQENQTRKPLLESESEVSPIPASV
jgi:MoaA/NifB/PqqE/SkfB family radical SAM enzyme